MGDVPLIDIFQTFVSFCGFGYTAVTLWESFWDREAHRQDGKNGSRGLTADIRVRRFRRRAVKHALFFLRGLLICGWWASHPEYEPPVDAPLPFGSIAITVVSLMLVWETFVDTVERRQLSDLMDAEERRGQPRSTL